MDGNKSLPSHANELEFVSTAPKSDHGIADEKNAGSMHDHGESRVKLDKHGLPLVPQPTDNDDDPLVSQPS